ncbi:MAG: ComF family protein [Bacteroidales bacterium]|nr:ComF family protein [Bacteroidales bacterium]MCF8332900.1 ComF family protein [Bacteroidales bacterium]
MKKILESLLYLLYPEICLNCGNSLVEGEEVLCISCEVNLPRTRFHSDPDNVVSQIFWGRADIKAATAFLYFRKGGSVQNLVHQLKYKGEREIGEYLGRLFGIELEKAPFFSSADMLIPVPLHPGKEKKRGYNQSYMIARGMGEVMEIPVNTENLLRKKFSETQTKKTRYSRWENVKEIFEVAEKKSLANKKVILVDDVVTTGATLEACAKVLTEDAKSRVGIATLAIASH